MPRIIKEVTQLLNNPPPGVRAEIKNENYLHLFVKLEGPPETVYETGSFNLEVYFP